MLQYTGREQKRPTGRGLPEAGSGVGGEGSPAGHWATGAFNLSSQVPPAAAFVSSRGPHRDSPVSVSACLTSVHKCPTDTVPCASASLCPLLVGDSEGEVVGAEEVHPLDWLERQSFLPGWLSLHCR